MEVMDYAGLKYVKPEGAFYLWVKVPDGWNADDMAFTNHLKNTIFFVLQVLVLLVKDGLELHIAVVNRQF